MNFEVRVVDPTKFTPIPGCAGRSSVPTIRPVSRRRWRPSAGARAPPRRIRSTPSRHVARSQSTETIGELPMKVEARVFLGRRGVLLGGRGRLRHLDRPGQHGHVEVGRGRRADPLRRADGHRRIVLLVRLAAHRPASRGPRRRGDRRGRGRARLLQPGQLLAASASPSRPRSPVSALAFLQIWLVIIGVVGILFTVGGLLFEYYVGGRHPLS